MDTDMVRRLLDACYLAKKVTETMPPLPEGLVPRHVHVMDAVFHLTRKKGNVHVGDVSAMMNATAPSVTRLIAELERLGYLTKNAEANDRRYVAIALSEKGKAFHARHVMAFHRKLARRLGALGDDDCRAAIAVMQAVHDKIRIVTRNFAGKEKK